MRRAMIVVGLLIIAVGTQGQPPELPQKGSGPGKPLDPKEAQKLFKLDDGLRIELVACEPQIESPVAMQFDPDGRLWVVEMRDYPNGPAKGEKPLGRIRILEDKDGDGFFETSTIWADNLLFANGIFLWKDGAIVTMAPKIAHLRDTKGAGKADKEDVFYVGFAEQNPQLRVSHPIMGPDGWIYCANGLRGGKAIRAGDANAKPVDLSGMDFRFDPVNLNQYEAITGPGQFGNTFDEWGNRFVCDNRHHLRHVVMENRYIKRNPYLAAPALLQDVSVLDDGPLSSGGKVYPLSKNWTTSSLHEGRFTAACGVFIYHGALLDQASLPRKRGEEEGKTKPPPAHAGGSQYHGAAFTCEPTGNLVHMEILTPKGATFEAKPHKKGVEFLATIDDWFRPVFLTHGPEGALYVVDMYRAVIEHPDFMPAELKNRPDLWAGKDKGRIWRIVPKDHKTKTPRPNLSKATTADLVKTLEHEEPWYRQTAQRLLLEKNDKAMVAPLKKMLHESEKPHAQILAAWLLDRQNAIDEEDLFRMLRSTHPRVIECAIRVAEPNLGKSKLPLNALMRHHNHRDYLIRYQVALTMGGLKGTNFVHPEFKNVAECLLATTSYDVDIDSWKRLAIQSALPDYTLSTMRLVSMIDSKTPGHAAMLNELGAMIASRNDPESLLEVVSAFGKRPRNSATWAGFAGIATGLERRGITFVSATDRMPESGRKDYAATINTLLSDAATLVRDSAIKTPDRLLYLRVLAHAPWPTAKQALLPLIEKEDNADLRIAALRALAAQQDKEVPAFLMKLWPGSAPSVRREILEAMLRQPGRVGVLLDEIESKRMKASELDPLRTRQLLNHKDAALKARAAKLLADNLPAERAKVVKEYQVSLELKGDAKNGREIFKKNCATCHRVAGVGVDVGPDIADTRTKTLPAMLNDILVPNAAIDANYVNYVVSMKDGRLLTGMMALETASSITLKRAEGQTDVILRKDIDEIGSTGVSLMPEGLEKNISVREMADLLSFLKNWRYLDGSVPVK